MWNRWVSFVLVFLLYRINEVVSTDRNHNLDSMKKLLNDDQVSLALILPKPKPKSKLLLQNQLSSLEDDRPLELLLDENKAYNFYHVLRTVQQTENLDNKAHDDFEMTKLVLRQALRSRCEKLDRCIRKCPPKKKKFTCVVTCKEDIDERDLCNEPEKPQCKRPKCGKTMPPNYWK